MAVGGEVAEVSGLSIMASGSGQLEFIDEAMGCGLCTIGTGSGLLQECLFEGGGLQDGACGSSTMVDGSGQPAHTEEGMVCG